MGKDPLIATLVVRVRVTGIWDKNMLQLSLVYIVYTVTLVASETLTKPEDDLRKVRITDTYGPSWFKPQNLNVDYDDDDEEAKRKIEALSKLRRSDGVVKMLKTRLKEKRGSILNKASDREFSKVLDDGFSPEMGDATFFEDLPLKSFDDDSLNDADMSLEDEPQSESQDSTDTEAADTVEDALKGKKSLRRFNDFISEPQQNSNSKALRKDVTSKPPENITSGDLQNDYLKSKNISVSLVSKKSNPKTFADDDIFETLQNDAASGQNRIGNGPPGILRRESGDYSLIDQALAKVHSFVQKFCRRLKVLVTVNSKRYSSLFQDLCQIKE